MPQLPSLLLLLPRPVRPLAEVAAESCLLAMAVSSTWLMPLLLLEPTETPRTRLPLLLCRLAPAEPAADCGRLARAAKGLGVGANSRPSAATSWSAVMLTCLLLLPLLLLLLLLPRPVRPLAEVAAEGCRVAVVLLALLPNPSPPPDVAAATTGRAHTPEACRLLALLLLLSASQASWL